jgi:PAS domain S-box-containing protein
MGQLHIDLYIAKPADRRLLCDFLRELGFDVFASEFVEETPRAHAGSSLVIADGAGARHYGSRLLELKWRSGPSFLPILITLPAAASSLPWLRLGFDDVIRQPIQKEELRARLDVYLRFRTQSEQYRSVFEDALIGLCRLAPDGRILIGNAAFARMLGYASIGELFERTDGVASRVAPSSDELRALLATERYAVALETTWRRADGEMVEARESVRCVAGDDGAPLYFESSIEDVSERQRLHASESAARRAAERQRKEKIVLADIYHDLAGSLRPEEIRAAIVRAVRELTGSDAASFIHREETDVVHTHPVGLDPALGGLRIPIERSISGRAISEGKPVVVRDVESEERFALDEVRSMHMRSVAIVPVGARTSTGAIGTYWSEPHQVGEDELRMMCALANAADVALANARLFEQMQTARLLAEEANRLKDEFLATVSHELRTPLTAIIGWATILRDDLLDNPIATEGLEVIERQSRAQSKIIEDLLDVSRIITGKLLIEFVRVDIGKVVAAAVESIQTMARQKGVSIGAGAMQRPVFARGDAARLQQVVGNLLSNAVKFTPAGGSVDVRVEVSEDDVVITVADTGEGIEPDFLPFVFDRFRQADGRTTRAHGGLGLGLAIVRNLVELHDGAVSVASEGPGRGATFTVNLPVASEQATLPAGRRNGVPHVPRAPQSLEGRVLLVVDDDPDTRRLLENILSRRGATVLIASSVDEAMALLAAESPDVLISDIGMPGRDGFDLIRTVRTQWPGLPAIAVSAFARLSDQERALADGFQAFVAKPVEADALVSTVARLAGEGPGPNARRSAS